MFFSAVWTHIEIIQHRRDGFKVSIPYVSENIIQDICLIILCGVIRC